jgi:hypothetical protein
MEELGAFHAIVLPVRVESAKQRLAPVEAGASEKEREPELGALSIE